MSLDKLFGVQRTIIDRDFIHVEHLQNYLLTVNDHDLEDGDDIQFKLTEDDREVWYEGVVRIIDKKIYQMSDMTKREFKVESVSRMKPTLSVDSDSVKQTNSRQNLAPLKVLTPSEKYVMLGSMMVGSLDLK